MTKRFSPEQIAIAEAKAAGFRLLAWSLAEELTGATANHRHEVVWFRERLMVTRLGLHSDDPDVTVSATVRKRGEIGVASQYWSMPVVTPALTFDEDARAWRTNVLVYTPTEILLGTVLDLLDKTARHAPTGEDRFRFSRPQPQTTPLRVNTQFRRSPLPP